MEDIKGLLWNRAEDLFLRRRIEEEDLKQVAVHIVDKKLPPGFTGRVSVDTFDKKSGTLKLICPDTYLAAQLRFHSEEIKQEVQQTTDKVIRSIKISSFPRR